MRFRFLIMAILISLASFSCKDDKEQGIEERNEVKEITSLSNDKKIKEVLTEGILTDSLDHPNEVLDFYRQNNFQPAWNERKYREVLYRNIETIEDDGLFFKDYHGSYLKKTLSNLDTNTKEENNRLEILLTDAFLSLSEDLGTGKLNPKDIYEIWGTSVNKINAVDLLKNAIKNGDIQEALDSARPHNIVYSGLKKSLKEFKENENSENTAITKIPEGKLIRPGESSPRVILIRKRFQELGYTINSNAPDSLYNSDLEKIVKDFQKTRGLEIDGLLGNSTIRNLNTTREDRYHQLLVNMERWRWYPRDLGDHYIIINVANFALQVVKNGDTVRTHKIMVGTQARKTPVFSDEISYIVYNPTWTIPPTIKKNDVIPGSKRDSEYLNKKHLKAYDRQGNIVNPSTIDWSSSAALNYTYRQQAGPANPLGLVKIIYPNKYMIYLHDTPSKALFDKNIRAQSSGCVRVQDALELAKYLLDDQDKYDDKKIQEILESGKTTEIPVNKKVQVHHFYWTAYRESDSIRFIEDVYNLDQDLWNRLKPQE